MDEKATLCEFLDQVMKEEGSVPVVAGSQLTMFCVWLLREGMPAESARELFGIALAEADKLVPQDMRKELRV